MVLVAVVLDMICTSGHLECLSSAMKNIFPAKGPAKSTCTCCQGAVGQAHGCNGACGGALLTLAQQLLPLESQLEQY